MKSIKKKMNWIIIKEKIFHMIKLMNYHAWKVEEVFLNFQFMN